MSLTEIYTTEALATGSTAQGQVRSTDGRIDLNLAAASELGGDGQGSNAEQIFAAGYAACFHSSLRLAVENSEPDLTDSSVKARVTIGRSDDGQLDLAVTLVVDLPQLDQSHAEELVHETEKLCPYSRAVRGNIEVGFSVTGASG